VVSREENDAWYHHRAIPGVVFKLADGVKIIGGDHRGKRGEVISLISTDGEPRYSVEVTSGELVEAAQSMLVPIDS
jgi:hypothetical protein